MLKFVLITFTLLHGVIHLLGVAKAFDISPFNQMTKEISKVGGLLWLGATVLFIYAVVAWLIKQDTWWIILGCAVFLSQGLIISAWVDAKWGTVINVFLLLIAVTNWGQWRFYGQYLQDVRLAMATVQPEVSIIREADLERLPTPVQNYLRYSQVVGKPQPQSLRIVFNGHMRGRAQDWFPFQSEQYNFFDDPTRLFFMRGKMFGLSVPGYHRYRDEQASMDIRLFGLIPVARHQGPHLFAAETVTFFNDLVLMAPGRLLDERIRWDNLNATSVRAYFTHRDLTVSATLHFNVDGSLANFIADERMSVDDGQKYAWSTPLKKYQDFGPIRLFSVGEAIWHYPAGEFVYGKFNTQSVEYNQSWLENGADQ